MSVIQGREKIKCRVCVFSAAGACYSSAEGIYIIYIYIQRGRAGRNDKGLRLFYRRTLWFQRFIRAELTPCGAARTHTSTHPQPSHRNGPDKRSESIRIAVNSGSRQPMPFCLWVRETSLSLSRVPKAPPGGRKRHCPTSFRRRGPLSLISLLACCGAIGKQQAEVNSILYPSSNWGSSRQLYVTAIYPPPPILQPPPAIWRYMLITSLDETENKIMLRLHCTHSQF